MSEVEAGVPLIVIGVSSCLLGEQVRYDGGHKRDGYISDVLGACFEFVSVCPEIEVGMGIPREPVQLVGDPAAPRMIGNETGQDWTERMVALSKKRLTELESQHLSGFILKKDSPSCGLQRVPICGSSGRPSKKAKGIWAHALMDCFPLMPVEDEDRLNDPETRENFIIRVFAYNRLQQLFWKGNFKRRDVIDFHTRHKYLMMAHSPKHYTILGGLVAEIAEYKPSDFSRLYRMQFMDGLKIKSTTKKNINVLHHAMGYFKKHLSDAEKTAILAVIEDFRKGLVPLIVPLISIRYYVDIHNIQYLKDQAYFNPDFRELISRNRTRSASF